MKKILIFSDTHGDINRCLDIIEKADSEIGRAHV